jgi:hypothetical protein
LADHEVGGKGNATFLKIMSKEALPTSCTSTPTKGWLEKKLKLRTWRQSEWCHSHQQQAVKLLGQNQILPTLQ